jgi:hypothetical protein
VTCGVGEDARTGRGLVVELRPAQGEDQSLGRIEVVHPEVQVSLHGRCRVRPGWRLMAGRSLER